MQTTFKTAAPADTETLVGMMRDFYEVDHMAFSEQVAREALLELMAKDWLGRLWLINDGGEVVGYVALTFCFSLEFGGRAAIIDELYLKASHRRKGLGLKALAFVEEFCLRLGVRALHLEVDRRNHNAQALYQKFGFEDRNNFYLSKWLLPPATENH
jgi:GNAT superfamily N-acetyltransferase